MNEKYHITATRVATTLFIVFSFLVTLGQNLNRLTIPPWETCWTHSFTMLEVCMSFSDVFLTTLTTPITLIIILILTGLLTEAYVKREAINDHFISPDDDS